MALEARLWRSAAQLPDLILAYTRCAPPPLPPAPAPRPRGAEGGCWPGAPPPSGMHASELHRPPTPPGGRARPAGVSALRLQLMMLPCSVPTRNLDGPATASYSIETAPKIRSEFFSFTWSVSTGSPSRRMSHQKTFPSVEHVMHSVPVLLCI